MDVELFTFNEYLGLIMSFIHELLSTPILVFQLTTIYLGDLVLFGLVVPIAYHYLCATP